MKIRKNLVRVSGWLVTAIALTLASAGSVQAAGAALVFQTDFSLKDGEPLLFLNSLLEVSLALNMDSFAKKFGIDSGPGWGLETRLKGKGSP